MDAGNLYLDASKKTGGVIDGQYQMVKSLAELAAEHPSLCAKAISLMIRCRDNDQLFLGCKDDLPIVLRTRQRTKRRNYMPIVELTG
jgi:hypothetical protein